MRPDPGMPRNAALAADAGRDVAVLVKGDTRSMRVCIVGASGKLGRYMVQHALDRGWEVAGVCRERSVAKLDAYKGRLSLFPGRRFVQAVSHLS